MASPRFAEKALSVSADLSDGPRHMLAGAAGGVMGSFAACRASVKL